MVSGTTGVQSAKSRLWRTRQDRRPRFLLPRVDKSKQAKRDVGDPTDEKGLKRYEQSGTVDLTLIPFQIYKLKNF